MTGKDGMATKNKSANNITESAVFSSTLCSGKDPHLLPNNVKNIKT